MKKYISINTEKFFAFNVWNVETAKAIIDASAKYNKNVIIQTSAKVFASIDQIEFAQWIRSYAAKKKISAYLHLDHCSDMALIKQAVLQGWDSVMVDCSKYDLDDNIRITNKVTDFAHSRDVLVEAEVGYIGKTNSEIGIASLDDCRKFLGKTDVDLFAAAVGNAHGLYHSEPDIRFDMIEKISEMKPIPFVIHGGSGLPDEQISHLITEPSVKKINISTDVKQAYRKAILDNYSDGKFEKDSFDPNIIESKIHEYVVDMAAKLIKKL